MRRMYPFPEGTARVRNPLPSPEPNCAAACASESVGTTMHSVFGVHPAGVATLWVAVS